MSTFTRNLALLFLPLFALALGWQLGARYEQQSFEDVRQQLQLLSEGGVGSGQILTDPEEEVDMTVFWVVWDLLLRNYVDTGALQARSLFFGAIRGLTASIGDPYTSFMTPEESQDFLESLNGKLQGIGAELTVRDGIVIIVAPLKGSPAERAGLRPDDVIIEVDGQSVEGKSLNDVVHRIRGPKGTKVVIGVLREGSDAPLSFTVIREEVVIPSTEYEVKETSSGSFALITLHRFGDDTVSAVTNAVEDVRSKKNIRGLVLDLRYNGGGYLDGAVSLTSLFLRQGEVVTVQRRTGEGQHHYVTARPLLPEIPLVVIINQGSASASEIVAGALQDHARATIVGMKSFGKGTVQEVFDLPGGSSVRITTAHWLTPKGRNLGKEGVEPDIVVDRTPEDVEAGNDPQLDTAIGKLFD